MLYGLHKKIRPILRVDVWDMLWINKEWDEMELSAEFIIALYETTVWSNMLRTTTVNVTVRPQKQMEKRWNYL